MKKIITVLLILTLLISFAGCEEIGTNYISIEDVNTKNIDFGTINYNAFDSYLWADLLITEKAFFYTEDSFYNSFTVLQQDGKKFKLFEHDEFYNEEEYFYDFIPLNDLIYVTGNDNESTVFYQFSLKDKKLEKIFEVNDYVFLDWMACKDTIVYTKNYYKNRDLIELCVYNVKNGKTTVVCDDVFEFSIINDKVRYLTVVDTENLALYEYDIFNNGSIKLCDIPITITQSDSVVNFTTNYTVFAKYDESDDKKILVCSNYGVVNEYTLPIGVYSLIAGENYAYALCCEYEDEDYEYVKNKANGVYKINLANGSYEKVLDVNQEDCEIYVVSDENVYLIEGDYTFGGEYQSRVHKINLKNKTKNEVLVLK